MNFLDRLQLHCHCMFCIVIKLHVCQTCLIEGIIFSTFYKLFRKVTTVCPNVVAFCQVSFRTYHIWFWIYNIKLFVIWLTICLAWNNIILLSTMYNYCYRKCKNETQTQFLFYCLNKTEQFFFAQSKLNNLMFLVQ